MCAKKSKLIYLVHDKKFDVVYSSITRHCNYFTKNIIVNGLKSLILLTLVHRLMEHVSGEITCWVRQKSEISPLTTSIFNTGIINYRLLESDSYVTHDFGYENATF